MGSGAPRPDLSRTSSSDFSSGWDPGTFFFGSFLKCTLRVFKCCFQSSLSRRRSLNKVYSCQVQRKCASSAKFPLGNARKSILKSHPVLEWTLAPRGRPRPGNAAPSSSRGAGAAGHLAQCLLFIGLWDSDFRAMLPNARSCLQKN